jgi:signal transduction histidine kinase
LVLILLFISENSTHSLLKEALKTALDSNAAKTSNYLLWFCSFIFIFSGYSCRIEFVAWLSHDLRTPLVGMFGFVDQLAEETNPTSEQKDLLEKLKVCTESVNGLITNLLDFSMLESGVFHLKQQIFNLRNSLQFHCSILQPLAGKKNIRLVYRFFDVNSLSDKKHSNERPSTNPQPLFVVGDWLRIQQLLTNLVTNGVKYSSDSSQIVVTCKFKLENSDGSFMDSQIHPTSPTSKPSPFVRLEISVEDQGKLVRLFVFL